MHTDVTDDAACQKLITDAAARFGRLDILINNAGIGTAVELYQKVFGADFHDPNAAEFKPDPAVMVRRSVLSAVSEQRRRLLAGAGAADTKYVPLQSG